MACYLAVALYMVLVDFLEELWFLGAFWGLGLINSKYGQLK